MRYRHSASFGKRQEFNAIAELLRRGYDVYTTLVDDQGIDCVVRQSPSRYFDVQIKARSKDCNPKNAGHFPLIDVSEARPNYVFVFYSERAEMYWVIPSDRIVEPDFANRHKTGPNEGRYRLRLTTCTSANEAKPRPKYAEYQNAFESVFGVPMAGQGRCTGAAPADEEGL